jgi:thioredoxin-related protein
MTLALLLALPALAVAPFRDLDWAAARKAAKTEKKLLFVDFVSDHCPPCERMDKVAFKDRAVLAALTTRAVAVKYNANRVPALARTLRVSVFPTLLVFDSGGRELDRFMGYRDAEGLLADLDAAVSGRSQLDRLDEKLKAATDEEAVDLRFERAKLLAGAGRDGEALAEMLWLFDVGMSTGSRWRGVRGSFLLGAIADVGRRHPPALEALESRRAAAHARLMAEPPDPDAASELGSLDRYLGKRDRFVALWDELKAGDPRRALVGRRVRDDLYFAKRYAESLEASGVADHAAEWTRLYRMAWDEGRGLTKDAMEGMRPLAYGEAARWARALAAAGRGPDAKALVARVLETAGPDARGPLRRDLEREGAADLLP